MAETLFTVPSRGIGLHTEALLAGAGQQPSYVLFLHGGGVATTSQGTRGLRDELAQRGIASVAFDFSGHGRSGGRMEEASLHQRREEALHVVQSLRPLRPHAIVATSMAGHTACRLSQDLSLDALVLFCPAAYEARAEHARFGEPFRAVIRSTRAFDDSPAFDALCQFEGRVLVFYGSQDTVIPPAVQQGYARAARRARSVEEVRLAGAGHRLHDWLGTRAIERTLVVERMVAALS